MLLSTIYGRESFSSPDRAVSINVYHKKIAGEEETVQLFTASRDQQSGVVQRNSSYLDASAYNSLHGAWTEATFDIPDGHFIKIWVNQKYEGDMFYDRTYLLLLVRRDAALRRLGVKLTQHERAVRTWGYFEGKFDVIDPEWFERMNVNYLPGEEYANLEYLTSSDKFRMEVLEGGAPFVPPRLEAIETRSGAAVQVSSRSRRVLRIGSNRSGDAST